MVVCDFRYLVIIVVVGWGIFGGHLRMVDGVCCGGWSLLNGGVWSLLDDGWRVICVEMFQLS